MRTFLLLTYSITLEYLHCIVLFFISNDILILYIHIIHLYIGTWIVRIYLRLPKSFRSHPLKTREIKIESDWMDWLNSKRFFIHRLHPPPHFAHNVRATVSAAAEVYIVVFLGNPNENTKLLKSFRASEFA